MKRISNTSNITKHNKRSAIVGYNGGMVSVEVSGTVWLFSVFRSIFSTYDFSPNSQETRNCGQWKMVNLQL